MGDTRPQSLTTCLGKILAAGRKLASLSLVKGLLWSIPGLPTAALAGVVILFFAWSCERQARQRDLAEAKQVKKQAEEEISRLQQQAANALRDAQQSTQAARALEAQQQQLAREAEGLRQSLESLRQQELARTNEVATLPTSEVVSRVASRLEEQGIGNREQGTGQQGQVTGNREQGTGQVSLHPLTRPALAGESASAGHPLPQRGEGKNSLGEEGRNYPGEEGRSNLGREGLKNPGAQGLNNPGQEGRSNAGGEGLNNPGVQGLNNPGEQGQKYPGAVSGQKQPLPGTQPLAPDASSASRPALVLSEEGVRKVETAFLELDSCRQQAQVMGEQVSNCQQQAQLDAALQQQQSGTIAKLNVALADKDQILVRSEEAHRAELKAARGTLRSRLFHAVEIFAGGFIAGVLVR